MGFRGSVTGSVRQQVHDGDTINVRAVGNFGVRFLGVDAPEISFKLPGDTRFRGLSDNRWEAFVSDPFAGELPPFDPPLTPGLLAHLQDRTGPGVAVNQHERATAAEDALEEEVLKDMEALGQTEDIFRFFLVFAYEVIDRYGRLLCFINRDQTHRTDPEPRPRSYNERLLQAGVVSPYFIWPNINPFRRKESLRAAVIPAGAARDTADADPTLRAAREWVCDARQQSVGIFAAENELALQPFEVRYLARRRPPNRWVIDLSRNDNILIEPQQYHTVPNVEDRLFVPEEFVPLFVEARWQPQA